MVTNVAAGRSPCPVTGSSRATPERYRVGAHNTGASQMVAPRPRTYTYCATAVVRAREVHLDGARGAWSAAARQMHCDIDKGAEHGGAGAARTCDAAPHPWWLPAHRLRRRYMSRTA